MTAARKFYGPYAQETGGAIQAQSRDEEGIDQVSIGVFHTDRD